MSAAVFVADAEPGTLGFLVRHLQQDGFKIAGMLDRFDLVLAGSFDHVERWVERAPVILIGSEQAGSVECIDALRRGCDDYVERPFDYQELVERIRAVLRRTRPRDPEVVESPPVRIEPRTRVASIDGRRVIHNQLVIGGSSNVEFDVLRAGPCRRLVRLIRSLGSILDATPMGGNRGRRS